ncbi:MAG: phytanoyl-CoA dioxygenase family protein [Gemmatimonadota bacterium]|nr:phytanoyl-CoA dioxygenase family protein [Gemmatimonadota bacterium]
MDTESLDYRLTSEEKSKFERDGFLMIEDAIPPERVSALNRVVDRVYENYLADNGLGPGERMNLTDFVGLDDEFLALLDWPVTFTRVWGILGWNIQLYHSHLIVTPPDSPEKRAYRGRLGLHQDSGRLNIELDATPRPRVSLKVAYFLTDTSQPDRGNFHIVPGSHLQNRLDFPDDGASDPPEMTPVLASAGSAVFFDRRLWHAAGINHSDVTRKVLFYGYSYRWLRPRDNMTVAHCMERCDPVQRQLLGESTGGMGYTSPTDADVPLKGWIREHVGEEAVAP